MYWILKNILIIFICFKLSMQSTESSRGEKDILLPLSLVRFARLRCLESYAKADIENLTDSPDTHCYLKCLLYKLGLMDLTTRGLDLEKIDDILASIEEAFGEDCLDQFQIDQPLNGPCKEYYDKLLEFKTNCFDLFEYTFGLNSTWRKDDSKSKSIGQSATEFCDSINIENPMAKETDVNLESTLKSEYKKYLQCIYKEIHYVDAYGRIDENEINLSYQEAGADTEITRDIIQKCSHSANALYHKKYQSDMVWSMESCLKSQSPEYRTILNIRNENSRRY